METNRLSQGQLLAAVSALLLFVISFLPWFSATAGVVTVGGAATASKDFSLWEAENPLDIYLLIVILVALVPAVLAFADSGRETGMAGAATALLAGVGVVLIIYQLFDHDFFGFDFSTKIGFWLGLLACVGIAVGGWFSMQEDVGGERY